MLDKVRCKVRLYTVLTKVDFLKGRNITPSDQMGLIH